MSFLSDPTDEWNLEVGTPKDKRTDVLGGSTTSTGLSREQRRWDLAPTDAHARVGPFAAATRRFA
jgi:hypothetical protein